MPGQEQRSHPVVLRASCSALRLQPPPNNALGKSFSLWEKNKLKGAWSLWLILQLSGAPTRAEELGHPGENSAVGIHLLKPSAGHQTPTPHAWIKHLIKTGGKDSENQFKGEKKNHNDRLMAFPPPTFKTF